MASANDIIEAPARIEPARLEETPEAIADAIAALCSASAALGARLHPATAANLSDLVRLMNCYYSNLIEGHDTRPRDIARAFVGDLDEDEGRRNLQIEAAAHVRVQEKIDRLAAEGRLPEPASRDFIRWLHAEFYRDAPEAVLSIKSALDPEDKASVVSMVYGFIGEKRSQLLPPKGAEPRLHLTYKAPAP